MSDSQKFGQTGTASADEAGFKTQGNAKFTVLIPTRERADVLFHSLRTVVAQDYDNLEIIVSDNQSGDHTREVVESFHDPRIRYLNTGKRLSMSSNWEFALDKVTEGWVTILGDDDGLVPGAIADVNALSKFGVYAILVNYGFFRWPFPDADASYGFLHVPRAGGYEIRQSAAWVPKVMRGSESFCKLPYIYTGGFIHTSVIGAIKARHGGRFFNSSIPDVFSALRVAAAVGRYLYCHKPKVVVGISRHSTGSRWKSDYQPLVNFKRENDIAFHEDVPLHHGMYPPSINAIVYESYLQASAEKLLEYFKTDPRRQLKYILCAPIDKAECVTYAKVYAEKHGIGALAFAGSRMMAHWIWGCRLPERALRKAIDLGNEKIVMAKDANVCDAAALVDWLNRNRPVSRLIPRRLVKNHNT